MLVSGSIKMKKFYINDHKTARRIAKDYNVELEFLREGFGKGYVINGCYMRVFVEGSHIDLSGDIQDLTGNYVAGYNAFKL